MAKEKSVKVKTSKKGFDLDRLLFRGGDQQSFLEDLATLVEDGVPAPKAVEVLTKVLEGPAKKVAENISWSLARGQSFSDGMVGWFPQYAVELVRIGEQGGTLVHNIRVAAEALGQQSEVLATLVSALTYPTIVLTFAFGMIINFNSKDGILQQFAQIKPVDRWPGTGQQLYELATFLTNGWMFLIIFIIGAVVLLNMFLKKYIGPGRSIADSLPVVNIYRRLTAANFMQTLGLLVSNGVVFKQALSLIAQQSSVYLNFHLRLMERRLSKGEGSIADVLDTGLIDHSDIVRLRAIAAAKNFEHALVRQGRQANANSLKLLDKIAKILGVVVLTMGAGCAGLTVMGIYSIAQTLTTP